MTKYILHGGEADRKTSANKNFFKEAAKNIPSPVNLLCVYFSRPKSVWQEKFSEDKINFSSASKKKIFNFIMASSNIKILKKQIKNADLIYLRGGDTRMLQACLGKLINLKQHLKNKVIAGSSAGALVLSEYYYDNDHNKFYKGLSILPIKVICHYSKKISNKLLKLNKYGKKVKIYALPEEKYIIIKE